MAMYGTVWQFEARSGQSLYLAQFLDAQIVPVLEQMPGFVSARTMRLSLDVVLSFGAFVDEISAREAACQLTDLARAFDDLTVGDPLIAIGRIHDRRRKHASPIVEETVSAVPAGVK